MQVVDFLCLSILLYCFEGNFSFQLCSLFLGEVKTLEKMEIAIMYSDTFCSVVCDQRNKYVEELQCQLKLGFEIATVTQAVMLVISRITCCLLNRTGIPRYCHYLQT
jgi:hypothetical protein